MNLAIVHDWLTNMGGAEKVVENFISLYPDAPIYTTMYNSGNLSSKINSSRVIPSSLQKKVKGTKVNHQKYLPFMPSAFESFDLNQYDIVLSSSSSCAKGVITNPKTLHVCFCHTPTRYVWDYYYEYTKDFTGIKKALLSHFMNYLRVWDFNAAQRVDYFIANSEFVSNRIWKFYRKPSVVIPPPAETDFFVLDTDKPRDDFYLCVSRLVSYKKVDIAVKAFNENGKRLVVAGVGPELEALKQMAKPNIEFVGRASDDEIKHLYQTCKAFIFPGEEDFGITPVEAQACGAPVIAYGSGGALETVLTGTTGVFFAKQVAESLVAAVHEFESKEWDSLACRKNAEKYSPEIFQQKISDYITEMYKVHTQSTHWEVL